MLRTFQLKLLILAVFTAPLMAVHKDGTGTGTGTGTGAGTGNSTGTGTGSGSGSGSGSFLYIDWSGVDEQDGDGSESFASLGGTLTASLSVRCNKSRGYSINFYTSNATTRTRSNLVMGSHTLQYRASLDMSGVQSANIRRSDMRLNNPSRADVIVRFNQSGNVLPNTVAKANWIRLELDLDNVLGSIPAMGTYTDVITATAQLN